MAGAAFLAGTGAATVRAQTPAANANMGAGDGGYAEETAMAVPRIAPEGGGSVSLPRPLSAETAARIREIFSLQKQNDFGAAQSLTQSLSDHTLLGDVLAARYLNPGYKASGTELREWLKTYSSLSDAQAIHTLLASISPKGSIPAFVAEPVLTHSSGSSTTDPTDPAAHAFTRNPALDRTVRERLASGAKGARSALYLIKSTPGMNDLYAAQLRAEVALSVLSSNDATAAFSIARDGITQSGTRLGFASYVAGLCAWQRGRADVALPLFEQASRAPLTSVSIRAASAFWAARAHERIGDIAAYGPWLHRAAASPRTFYGMLAAQMLSLNTPRPKASNVISASYEIAPQPHNAVMGEIDVQAVLATRQGKRLFALLQVGERDKAESLIRLLWPQIQNDSALRRSVQLVSQAAGLTELSEQLNDILTVNESDDDRVTQLPMPRLSPRHGFRMDPALVYALTRVESNFVASASSGAGAHGLMQIMPVTANFILHGNSATHPFQASPEASNLADPSTNLEIGQLYVLYLAQMTSNDPSRSSSAGGDLLRMLASYNAGPNAIIHWENLQDAEDDPLLFIETLPNSETRDYVHNTLSYLWLYAERMHIPTPSLAALARNEWPGFAAEQALARRNLTLH